MRIVTACALALLTLRLAAGWGGGQPESPASFAKANVHFEQNATDGDVEVVFEATGGSDGLVGLVIAAPDGRTVANFNSPDRTTLGMRQFVLESPEPSDVAALKRAYPEGEYSFSGRTLGGQTLTSRAALSHQLPKTTSFVMPAADAKDVRVAGLELAWVAVADAVGYIVELEEEGSETSLTVRLPAATTRFAVPIGFLKAGHEYQLGLGTISAAGNISYVETSFTTAAR